MMPPRVLASGPKTCGGNELGIYTALRVVLLNSLTKCALVTRNA